jgi:insulin-like growth factor-binding protein complex acid labile subunit
LSVGWCGLRTVELGAFRWLTELKGLYLWGNELIEIIPGTFGDMSKLEYLNLGDNRLEYLDNAVFSGLVNLRYLNLGGNKLQYLHPDTFLWLPKLQRLYLSSNPDLQIPTDRNFINSHSLSHLDISHCNVRSVSFETFTNISALEWLDLRYNNLRTVDINILRALLKLSGLYLYGNWLQCDCQLQEVWRWCEDRNITTGVLGEVLECDRGWGKGTRM